MLKGIAVALISLLVSFFAVATFVNAQSPTNTPTPTSTATTTPTPTSTTPSGAPATGF